MADDTYRAQKAGAVDESIQQCVRATRASWERVPVPRTKRYGIGHLWADDNDGYDGHVFPTREIRHDCRTNFFCGEDIMTLETKRTDTHKFFFEFCSNESTSLKSKSLTGFKFLLLNVYYDNGFTQHDEVTIYYNTYGTDVFGDLAPKVKKCLPPT